MMTHEEVLEMCLRSLVNFIEEHDMNDEAANDGDGRIDTWRSFEFESLIQNAKLALKPIRREENP